MKKNFNFANNKFVWQTQKEKDETEQNTDWRTIESIDLEVKQVQDIKLALDIPSNRGLSFMEENTEFPRMWIDLDKTSIAIFLYRPDDSTEDPNSFTELAKESKYVNAADNIIKDLKLRVVLPDFEN